MFTRTSESAKPSTRLRIGEDFRNAIANLRLIQNYHTAVFAKFAERLKGMQMATVRCSTIRSFCSEATWPTATPTTTIRCRRRSSAVAAASRADSTCTIKQDTPHSNMLVTMLDRAGFPAEDFKNFADSTGPSRRCNHAEHPDPNYSLHADCWPRRYLPSATRRQRKPAAAPQKPAADVNKREADGSTPLQWAVYDGNVAEVRRLLKAGANVSLANNYGATPMGLAAEVGNAEIIKLLLEAGANADSPNPEGQTALMAVARTGNVEAAELLVEHGATIDAREKWGGQTALMWASARRHPQMMQFLISKGADVNARSIDRDYQRHVTAEGDPRTWTPGDLRRCCMPHARTVSPA